MKESVNLFASLSLTHNGIGYLPARLMKESVTLLTV